MSGLHTSSLTILALASSLPSLAADWSPRRAAEYLDGRQQAWFAWARTEAPGGPCVSCHSGVTYLLARPVLRRALGESSPTAFETGLVDGLKARLEPGSKGMFRGSAKEPRATQAASIEAVIAALFVGSDRAYERMWELQKQGAWAWFDLQQDPWEASHSGYYGAALAAVASGRSRTRNSAVAELATYLRETQAAQPLHNRLMLLWASASVPEAAPRDLRQRVVAEVLRAQREDGGWSMESLGPFPKHDGAPEAAGSSAYATALAAYALEQAGVARTDAGLARALAWLGSHQDAESGSWRAVSLNRAYEAGSIPSEFMSEAATAYAVMALLP